MSKTGSTFYEFDCRYRVEHNALAGIDEAGRGPLAGPLIAAAVCFPPGLDIDGINDSKRLTRQARERLYDRIVHEALDYSTGIVEPFEIDSAGMSAAVRSSFQRAVSALTLPVDLCIVDGLAVGGLGFRAEFVVKGDTRSLCVAAAGIVAKVTRDRIMTEADSLYPGYGFRTNMGYGTKEHLAALGSLGPCPIHRRSFSPLRTDGQLRLPID